MSGFSESLRAGVDFCDDPEVLLAGLRAGKVGVWRWKLGSEQLQWSENLPEVHGLPPTAFDGTLSNFQDDIHPDDRDRVWSTIQHALETGEPYRTTYRCRPRPGVPTLWIEATGALEHGADGATYLTGTCTEVTQRVIADELLSRRLRQQQAIADLGSLALAEPDLQRVMDHAVAVACEQLDVPLAKILQLEPSEEQFLVRAGVGLNEGVVGKTRVPADAATQAGYTLLTNEAILVEDLARETRFRGHRLLHDHGVHGGMTILIAGTGERPFGVLGVHTNVVRQFDHADVDFLKAMANIIANAARQHAAGEQRTLLLREMAHRAGNMLQLVGSIANQTFVSGCDLPAAQRAFAERLSGLSRANTLLMRTGWRATGFDDLVRETLDPFAARLVLAGEAVTLPADLSFDLGLVLHELATNSVKYGTLGWSDGSISVTWSIEASGEGRRFVLDWNDPVGKDDAAESSGTGFGSKLLHGLVERKWGGEIAIATDAGYRFTCSIPLAERS